MVEDSCLVVSLGIQWNRDTHLVKYCNHNLLFCYPTVFVTWTLTLNVRSTLLLNIFCFYKLVVSLNIYYLLLLYVYLRVNFTFELNVVFSMLWPLNYMYKMKITMTCIPSQFEMCTCNRLTFARSVSLTSLLAFYKVWSESSTAGF